MSASVFKPLSLATALVLAAAPQASLQAAQPAAASTPVYDVGELDPSISACKDFNAYANGKWIAANPIPADRVRWGAFDQLREQSRSEEHTSELQSLMRISYAVFCLKKKKEYKHKTHKKPYLTKKHISSKLNNK